MLHGTSSWLETTQKRWHVDITAKENVKKDCGSFCTLKRMKYDDASNA